MITAEVTQDIVLLDVTHQANFQTLRARFAVQTQDDHDRYEQQILILKQQLDQVMFDEFAKCTDPALRRRCRNDILEKYRIKANQLVRSHIGHQIPLVLPQMDVLQYAFDDGQKRYSHTEGDRLFSEWICANLKFDGWGLTAMAHWHDEIMICNPTVVNITRLPYEFRFGQYNDNDTADVYLTQDGAIVKEIPMQQLFGGYFKQFQWHGHYQGDTQKRSDQYLFNHQ